MWHFPPESQDAQVSAPRAERAAPLSLQGSRRAQGQHPAVAPHSPTERKAEGQGSAQGEIYLNIEVCEERDQGDHVPDLEIQPPEGEATPPEESAARLNDCQHKLDLEEQGQRWAVAENTRGSSQGTGIRAPSQVLESALASLL